MNILAEDIGYTYGPLLDAKLADIIIKYRDTRMDSFEKINVLKVEPLYEQTIEPGIGNTDISMSNGKSININYRFLSVKKANYKKHYLKNMSTSGVEIRLNGRLLADNLFSEIWSVEQHNEYNYLLVQIDVQSDDAGCLPETTTNKTSLMQDDPILEKIYGWIKAKLPNPKTRAALSDHETELFDELKEKKKKLYKDIDSSSVVKTEQYAFSTLNEKIRIDLYQSVNNKVTIYEGKKGKTTPKDVYQLLMYWDGLVFDQMPINQAILIASEHPESVKKIVKLKCNSKDSNGKNYNITLKTWNDEDIAWPN